MNSVGIIGFGRFGKILSNILQKGFMIKVYDIQSLSYHNGVQFTTLEEVLQEKVIFIAVPIRHFESLINNISGELKNNTTIIDVCSVKKYTSDVMKNILPEEIGIISSHPMFGPDSYLSNKKLKMMMHSTRDIHNQYDFWKKFFSDQNIKILEMTPDMHDRLAAKTQGVTHFLGRTLKEFGIQKTNLDTQGFRDLIDLVEQTCNDTWELYADLQTYNPYTEEMINNLKNSVNFLEKQLKELNNE
jgi:prephenate dehydrogenase